jgi:hypothetical protein
VRRTDRAMPKAVVFIVVAAVIAAGVAACGGSSSGPTPTPVPSTSSTPDPAIRAARIAVTVLGTPAPYVPVAESTPLDPDSACRQGNGSACRPGKTIVTQTTDKSGETIFRHLTPSQTYCWVATIAPGKTSSACAGWPVWQTGTVTLGT